MNELWRMTFYLSETYTEPYYEDNESLLFNEELDRVKFSLSDQYQHKYNSFEYLRFHLTYTRKLPRKLAFKQIN